MHFLPISLTKDIYMYYIYYVPIVIIYFSLQVYNTHVYNIWLIGLLALVQGLTGK